MSAAIPLNVLLLRIAIGSVLGGVIGYERDIHGRPVGLRTHVLVGMASSTFMVVSTQFPFFQGYGAGDGLVEVDASRIAASVVSGIGFLAGGAILRAGLTVRGLTTAAGLWLVTAIGLSAGGGMYWIAAAVTLMGTVSLLGLRRFEDKNDEVRRGRVLVVTTQHVDVSTILEAARRAGVSANNLEVERRYGGKERMLVSFDASLPNTLPLDQFLSVLERSEGVQKVRVRTD
ncbi:MAG: MgtC/SapB family protein [Sandaracinaceae bacterium]|nr:MgtC/SapB family protein [Sandaracinaceae bacterium]